MSHTAGVRWWAVGALVAGAIPLSWLVVVADGWTVNRLVVSIWTVLGRTGLPVSPEDVDLLLNTVMLLPFALLAGLALPRAPWWGWAIAGLAVSAAVEYAQLNLARDASLADVVTNTAGAFLGAFASRLINARLARTPGPAPGAGKA